MQTMKENAFTFRKGMINLLVVGITICTLGYLSLGIAADMFWSKFADAGRLANIPAELFEHIITRLIPADVRDLQGGGYTWHGDSIWLRFRASQSTMNGLIIAPYQLVDCAVLVKTPLGDFFRAFRLGMIHVQVLSVV